MGRPNGGSWAAAVLLRWCLLAAVAEASHVVYQSLQSVPATVVISELRTGFHFQPPKHWINDPNGPMYYNGVYRLFYQYNPYGSAWGNIVWAHSVSTDLINWVALEPAIYPSKPFDVNGCWSGSATVLPWNAFITTVNYFSFLYPGVTVDRVFFVACVVSNLLTTMVRSEMIRAMVQEI